jgi:transcriptional regulator with XRE-family HTH domain
MSRVEPSDLRKLGIELQRARAAKNLSLQELAGLTGLEKQSLHRYENGKVNPTVRTLLKIAIGLDVNISELVHILDHKPQRLTGEPS